MVRPDSRQIECFLTVAEELHFGRAAERLLLTQPRVSQSIRSLERQVGAALFDRTHRRVQLTPLGVRLRDDLMPVYRQLCTAMEQAANAARGVTGQLHVGFLGSAANELTADIVTRFSHAHPDCELVLTEVHCNDPLGPLRSGDVDALMTRLPVREPDLTVGPILVTEARMLAVPTTHAFAGRPTLSIEDLPRCQVINVDGPAPDYWWDDHAPRATPTGRVIPRGPTVSTFQELLAAVAAGRGVSPVVESVSRYYARPDIKLVPISDMPPSQVALVWRASGYTERVRTLARHAEAVARAASQPQTPARSQ